MNSYSHSYQSWNKSIIIVFDLIRNCFHFVSFIFKLFAWNYGDTFMRYVMYIWLIKYLLFLKNNFILHKKLVKNQEIISKFTKHASKNYKNIWRVQLMIPSSITFFQQRNINRPQIFTKTTIEYVSVKKYELLHNFIHKSVLDNLENLN